MATRLNQTTINISKHYKEKLESYKNPDETWDDIIKEVLDFVESNNTNADE